MDEAIVNFDDPQQRLLFLSKARELHGSWRVNMKRYRPRRTDRQNALYWVAVVHPFADFLREQGESYTDDDAHEVLKAKFLRESIVNKDTGEMIGEYVKSTTRLNTEEFSIYIENCMAWLADMFGIVCRVGMEFSGSKT